MARTWWQFFFGTSNEPVEYPDSRVVSGSDDDILHEILSQAFHSDGIVVGNRQDDGSVVIEHFDNEEDS